MGADVYVTKGGTPVQGAEVWAANIGIPPSTTPAVLTDSQGHAYVDLAQLVWPCPYAVVIHAAKGGDAYVSGLILVNPIGCKIDPVYAELPGGGEMTWDVRTTDLWVHEVNQQGAILHSWNILQGQVPEIPCNAGYSNLRVDARLRNYGSASVAVRLVAQTVSLDAVRQGGLIYTPFANLGPAQEIVHVHWLPMWCENVYQRLWVDNRDLPAGNCPAGQAPPWTGCRQGELFDYLVSDRPPSEQWRSNRHLVYCRVKSGGIQTAIEVFSAVGVNSSTTTVAQGEEVFVSGALVRVSPYDAIPNASIHIFVDNVDYQTTYTDATGKFTLFHPGFTTLGAHIFKAKFLGS